MILVAFEGLSGSGKSTAIRALTRYFRAKKYKVGTMGPDRAKDFKALHAIEKKYHILHPLRNLLFLILRMQQGMQIQKMREKKYDIVFTDRYSGSSCVFMKCGGFPEEFLLWAKENVRPKPNITFFFKIPSALARKRKYSRSLEQISNASRNKIEATLEAFAKTHKWKIVHASESPKSIQNTCIHIIEKYLRTKKPKQ